MDILFSSPDGDADLAVMAVLSPGQRVQAEAEMSSTTVFECGCHPQFTPKWPFLDICWVIMTIIPEQLD